MCIWQLHYFPGLLFSLKVVRDDHDDTIVYDMDEDYDIEAAVSAPLEGVDDQVMLKVDEQRFKKSDNAPSQTRTEFPETWLWSEARVGYLIAFDFTSYSV